ncbi:hypothetical protein [Streptomyces sp. NPDC101455]
MSTTFTVSAVGVVAAGVLAAVVMRDSVSKDQEVLKERELAA